MNHEKLKLESISKLFEFEKISREIDSCTDLESLKDICKCYVKLYMKQEETISSLGVVGLNN
jgi:hypothetical protein